MSQAHRTIVVPLDMSGVSEEILLPAARLACALQYDLVLLHVVEPAERLIAMAGPTLNPDLAVRWETDMQAKAQQYLANVAQRIERPGLAVRTHISIATDSAAAILTYVRDHHAQMIAMTTHGQTGMRYWTLGSVAEQVIHAAPVPLLLVRSQASSQPQPDLDTIRTILVPLDGSTLATQALQPAQMIAAATGATLVLVAVAPHADDLGLADGGIEPLWMLADCDAATQYARHSLESAARQLHAQGIAVQTRVLAGDPAAEIVRASAAEHTDLIVMATHGRSRFQRLMLGSVAQKVLHAAEQPLLLVRPSRTATNIFSHATEAASVAPIG